MTSKPTKTRHELQALIMQEIRKNPEFRNIGNVAITQPTQLAPHLPNWSFAWVLNGASLAPPEADEIPQKLQREYDLA
jgi:hypothetical protein